MRAREVELLATATVEAGAVLEASALVLPDELIFEYGTFDPEIFEEVAPPWEMVGFTWAVDASAEERALARTGYQESGVEIYVGGELVPLHLVIGEWRVVRDRSRSLQEWSFRTPIDEATGMGPFGDPVEQLGSPLGKRTVDIYGVLRVGSGLKRVPLLVGGVAHAYSANSSATGEQVETHGGVDAGCPQRALITYVKAPGQRIRRDVAIREMLALAGETDFRLESMGVTNKPIQFVERDPVSAGQELCEVEGRVLQRAPGGAWRNPRLRGGGPIRWRIREDDLLEVSALDVGAPADVVTRVRVNGAEWIAAEIEEGCPLQAQELREVTERPYVPARVRWTQQGDCTITDPGPTSSADEPHLLETRVIVRTALTRCGVTVGEIVEEFGWKARETYRYTRDGADFTALACRAGARFLDGGDDAPVANGSEPAVAENERFRLLRRTSTLHYWNLPGWNRVGGPSVHVLDLFPLDHLQGTVVRREGAPDPETGAIQDNFQHVASGFRVPYFGAYLGWLKWEEEFYAPRAALKERGNPNFTWEEEDYLIHVKIFGSGDAVDTSGAAVGGSGGVLNDGVEVFQVVRVEAGEVHSNQARQVEKEVVRRAGHWARPGVRYLYGGNRTSRDAKEGRRTLSVDETIYGEATGDQVPVIERHEDHTDPGASFVRTVDTVGARPAAELLPFLDEELIAEIEAEAGRLVFVSSVEAAMERVGAPDPNRAFSVPVVSTNLELRHCLREVPLPVAWAETPEEAERYGALYIGETAAITVRGVLLFNPFMEETDAAEVHYWPRKFLRGGRRAELRRVEHRGVGRDAIPTTTFEARVYLDEGVGV